MGSREKQEFLCVISASPSLVNKCHKSDVLPSGCVFASSGSNDRLVLKIQRS